MLAVASAYTLTESSAELALLVRSDLKGMGMGSMLLDRLIERCRRRRFSLLVADVLQENTRMLRLADKCGFRQKAAQLGTAREAARLCQRDEVFEPFDLHCESPGGAAPTTL